MVLPQQARITDTEQLNITMDIGIDEFPISIRIDFSNPSLQHNMEVQDAYAMMRPGMNSGIRGQAPLDSHIKCLDWTASGGQPG